MDTIGTVYGVLLNDAATVARLAGSFSSAPYKAPPRAPVLYIKSRNTFANPGSAVAIPATPGEVVVEATVGAVIGRRCTAVEAQDALSYVKGFLIASDITLPHASYYRPAVRERCRDGFLPLSETRAPGGFDPASAEIVTSINGVEVHRRSLATLVRSVPRLLEDISEFMTLEENDVLLVGLPDSAPTARPGDRVDIHVSGLGALTHSIALEEGAP